MKKPPACSISKAPSARVGSTENLASVIAATKVSNSTAAESVAANRMLPIATAMLVVQVVSFIVQKPTLGNATPDWKIFPSTVLTNGTARDLASGMNKGIQPQQNHHPCVKPIALNEWLARLILPPKRSDPRRLLVPYCGYWFGNNRSNVRRLGRGAWDRAGQEIHRHCQGTDQVVEVAAMRFCSATEQLATPFVATATWLVPLRTMEAIIHSSSNN